MIMKQRRRSYGFCLLLVTSACAFGPISSKISKRNHADARIRSSSSGSGSDHVLRSSSDEDILNDRSPLLSGSGSGKTNSAFSRNEFSRILHVDRIFQHRRRSGSINNEQQRDHEIRVKASVEECKSLAKRFDLKALTRLEADLAFRPAAEALVEASGASGGFPVEAEGIIEAHLIQMCVRTNDEFEMDVEFPIYAIIKPVATNNDEDLKRIFRQQMEEEEAAEASGKKKKKNNKKKPKDDAFHENKKTYDLRDVFDLQKAIQDADYMDDGGAAELVEDESIYSLSSEQLDVGELIAQTLFLQLDPFPKKPGSDPVSWEISG